MKERTQWCGLWRLNRNGKYSVKSAYYQLMERVADNEQLRVQGDWNKIWKLKVPNKIKMFIWRFARGVLSMGKRLVMKEVQCPTHAAMRCVVRLLRMTGTVLLSVIMRCRSGRGRMLESAAKYCRKCIRSCRFCIPHAGKSSGSAEEFIYSNHALAGSFLQHPI
jgi:hypothetical protein